MSAAHFIRRRGQTVVETLIGFIAVVVFLLGTVRVFYWLVAAMVERQRNYDRSRRDATRPQGFAEGNPGILPAAPKELDVWGKGN